MSGAFLRALRAVLRLELRELGRHRGRSALILALVAIPVAAVVGGTTLVKITTPTDEERRSDSMGHATLRVEDPFEYEQRREILDLLPANTTIQRWRQSADRISVPGRQLQSKSIVYEPVIDAEDPAGLASSSFLLVEGRAPANAGEVALSPSLAQALGVDLGDTVTLEFGAPREIVGWVADRESTDTAFVVRTAAAVEHQGVGYLLLAPPVGTDLDALTQALESEGIEFTLRSEVTGEGSELAWAIFVLGTIGFLEAGLVVASTFIVGLRRRQYEIGLLGSAGATPMHISSGLLGSTGAIAVPGVFLGALVGILTSAALHPFLDGWNGRDNGSFEVAWGTLVAALVLGVGVAILSTAIPAWSAGRLPIRVAMGGRRPTATPSSVWLILGLGMVGLGLLLVIFAPRDHAVLGALGAIVGSILGVLGFGVASPFFLDVLGRNAGGLPLKWRLAVRDAGRFRARNGPVVTAVLAGMAMSVTVAVLVASLTDAIRALPSPYRTDQLLVAGPDAENVARELFDTLGGVALSPLEAVYIQGEPLRVELTGDSLPNPDRQWVTVGDAELLRTIGAEAGLDALNDGHLVQLEPETGSLIEMMGLVPESERGELKFTTWRDERPVEPLPTTSVVVDQNVRSPSYVLHRSKVEQLGWQTGPPLQRSITPWLVRLGQGVDAATLSRAQAVAKQAAGVTVDAQLLRNNPIRGFYHIVQWLCILTGLVIVLVATALSSVESAADARILKSVGAGPRILRGHQAARAAYLAFLGCVLAIPAGLTPAIVMFEATNLPLEVVVPWLDLIVVVVALPTLAYFVAGFSLRTRGGLQARGSRLATASVIAFAFCASAYGGESASVRWEPYAGTALDGSPLAGEVGKITVPRRHTRTDGETLEIAFVRYRTTHPKPGPPIIFLAGGPGGAGAELVGGVATHPQLRLLEHADVIGIDQRGTGMSRPELNTPEDLAVQLPLDRVVTRREQIAAHTLAAQRIANYWGARGVDPRVYNTRESADDIEAVRRALGLEQVVLYGASYGTHLGLTYLRRHPQHVTRAALIKVEGPDDTWKLPSTVQRHLAALHVRTQGDPRVREALPDLLGTVASLLEQLRREPVTATVAEDGDTSGGTIVLGEYDLQRYLSNELSFSPSAAEIPRTLLEFARGDWSRLADSALETRTVSMDLMPWATDCASGASDARRARIESETRDPANLLGDGILAPFYPASCEPCVGCRLDDEFRAPINADVPVLFSSGTFDVRTPPENVETIQAGFRNSVHVIAERAGHDSRELMSPEYRGLFQGFLRGDAILPATITLPSILMETAPGSDTDADAADADAD